MIIEIIDDDYYSSSNSHIVMEDYENLPKLYKEWYELNRPNYSFENWLVESGHASWPKAFDYITYSYGDSKIE